MLSMRVMQALDQEWISQNLDMFLEIWQCSCHVSCMVESKVERVASFLSLVSLLFLARLESKYSRASAATLRRIPDTRMMQSPLRYNRPNCFSLDWVCNLHPLENHRFLMSSMTPIFSYFLITLEICAVHFEPKGKAKDKPTSLIPLPAHLTLQLLASLCW